MRCPKHDLEYVPVGYGVLACPNPKCDKGTTTAAIEDKQDREKREAVPIAARKVTIELPIPPSVNTMFPDGNGKRGLSEQYRDWRDAAGWELKTHRVQPYCTPVLLDMRIIGGKGFPTSSDISNRWKAIEDLLVTHGILKDDNVKFVVGHCDRYEEATDKTAPARCIITIESVEKGEEG